MKKFLLFCMLTAISAIGFSQTYSIYDVDNCVFLNTLFGTGNGTYTPSKSNPVGADASVNVSSINPSGAGTFVQQRFYLPGGIATTGTTDFIMRYYSASSTSNFRIVLQNSTVGDGTFLTLVSGAKTAGSWQTINLSSFSLTTGNSTTDNTIDTAGGWNVIRIYSEDNVPTIDQREFFFDNIQININPNLADENADLASGNLWVYNNRDGDNRVSFVAGGSTSTTENSATPTTTGNSASTVLRYTKANAFSTLRFNIPSRTGAQSGIVKFRVYLDNCQPTLTNTMRIRLGESTFTNYLNTATADVVTITDKKWVECSFDLSKLTGDTSKTYTTFEIILDQGDNALKSGNIYYFDAIQGPFAGTTTFTGANNGSWTVSGNWSNGVPNELFNATVPSDISVAIFGTTKASVNNLTMSGASRLTLQGDDTEIFIKGAATEGSLGVRYRRLSTSLGTANWYLVSIPAGGGTINQFDFDLASGTGNNTGFASYNTANNSWVYKQASAVFSVTNGVGYSIKRDPASAQNGYNFEGTTINDADVQVSVVTGGSGSFNLLGNPFLASIKSASFLTANTADLSSQTIWVWNGSTYETKVTVDNFIIAPTQGFFVSANKATNLTFAKSSQTTGGVFQKGNGGKTEVKLLMTDGSANRFAKLYYFDNNVSTGFDNGYDGETFSGQPNDFDVFTHLISDNQGKEYQIQSLPTADMETMIVPVGVKAEAGKEITFSVNALNLPKGINVYLEDREANTFTRLDQENSTYKVTLSQSLNDVGRFYLRTSATVLNVDDVIASDKVNVYTTDKNTIKVVGLEGDVKVTLFNVLGKQVLQTKFNSKGVSEFTIPNFNAGVYIVNFVTNKGKVNKKIVLE